MYTRGANELSIFKPSETLCISYWRRFFVIVSALIKNFNISILIEMQWVYVYKQIEESSWIDRTIE